MTSSFLIIIGLLLDVIGVALIWAFGMPRNYFANDDGNLKLEEPSEAERKKRKLHKWLSGLGLFLIILGFIFQIVGNLEYTYKLV